jgi:hypothetical protein
MDTVSLAALASGLSQARIESAVQLAVLKKAMDIEAQGALQLVQAAVQAAPPVNPPNLGNQVDVFG